MLRPAQASPHEVMAKETEHLGGVDQLGMAIGLANETRYQLLLISCDIVKNICFQKKDTISVNIYTYIYIYKHMYIYIYITIIDYLRG